MLNAPLLPFALLDATAMPLHAITLLLLMPICRFFCRFARILLFYSLAYAAQAALPRLMSALRREGVLRGHACHGAAPQPRHAAI